MLVDLLGSIFRFAAAKPRSLPAGDCYSIVVCSIDNDRFAAFSASVARAFGKCPYELIRIPDASSMCGGYNKGLQCSRGSRVIFCHDDIEILSEDFVERLDGHFNQFDVFGLVGTTRLIEGSWVSAGIPDIHGAVVQPASVGLGQCSLHVFSGQRTPVGNAQGLDGMFIAAQRAAAIRLGWDEVNIPGFHLYDIDFSFRAHCAGLRVGIATDLLVYHESLGKRDDAWRKAVLDFNKRHAAFLSQDPPGTSEFRTATCADRFSAYQIFCNLLRE